MDTNLMKSEQDLVFCLDEYYRVFDQALFAEYMYFSG